MIDIGDESGRDARVVGARRGRRRVCRACLAHGAWLDAGKADWRIVLPGSGGAHAHAIAAERDGFWMGLATDLGAFGHGRRPVLGIRFCSGAGAVIARPCRRRSAPSIARTFWLLHNVASGALIVHALFVVWNGWRGDLVEQRRRLRGPILAISAVYAFAVIIVQTWEIYFGFARSLSPIAAGALMCLGLLALAAFGRMEPDLFRQSQRNVAKPESDAPSLTGEDARLAAALDRLMQEDRIYREEGLSVSSLALKLKLPEHRLRRLINQQLGHRNFNAFVNQWRRT